MARRRARKAGRRAVKSAAPLSRLKALLPPLAVAALVVGVWWIAVIGSETVIFPTPLQVVAATIDLVRDGTLWDHIGASLYRVGAGFLLAVIVGIPLGLLCGIYLAEYDRGTPLAAPLRFVCDLLAEEARCEAGLGTTVAGVWRAAGLAAPYPLTVADAIQRWR